MSHSASSSPETACSDNPGHAPADRPESASLSEDHGAGRRKSLHDLSRQLGAVERELADEGGLAGAAPLEALFSTRELLLDELVEQLGAWESEIVRRREALDRQQRALDARQVEVDRLAKELAEGREQLGERQLEVERAIAAAEARLAAFSQVERALRPADRPARQAPASPAGPSSPRPAPPHQCESTLPSSPPRAAENSPRPSQDPNGLATARFLAETSDAIAPPPQGAARAESPAASASPTAARHFEGVPRPGGDAPADAPANLSPAAGASDPDLADTAIEQYLTTLLSRGRKGAASGTAALAPPAARPATDRTPSAPASGALPTTAASVALPPRPTRRPAAPIDLTAHLPALRDVANESARSALHYYSKQRIAEWLKWTVVAVMATLVMGMAMFWFSRPLAVLAAGSAVIVACGALLMISKHAANRLTQERDAPGDPAAGTAHALTDATSDAAAVSPAAVAEADAPAASR
jgi:hypothetical protein